MLHQMIREGDILKAKPKHFKPRQEGVVRSPNFMRVAKLSTNQSINYNLGKRWATPSNRTYLSRRSRICSSRAHVALPSRRNAH